MDGFVTLCNESKESSLLGLINLLPSDLEWLMNASRPLRVGNLALSVANRGIAMRVLLIEDEPTTAKSIELMLGTEGFNVYTTDLGEEGLDLGKLYDYDIILLDLNLPDMHGYDVLKKLRTAKVGTPVLILSGIGEMDSARSARSASAPTIM